MRQRLRRWLGVNESVAPLMNEIVALRNRIEVLEAPKQEITAADILERSKSRKQVPIRIQRKPFRETKALMEQALDPQYQAMQQRIRDEADKQPRSL